MLKRVKTPFLLNTLNRVPLSTAKKYRMVALDLDGTLLRSNHKISDETKEYLTRLDKQGFTVCIATGRAAATVYEHVQRLGFPHPIPVVCSNGSRGLLCSIDEQQDGSASCCEELFSTPVPEAVSRRTIALSREMGHVTQYYVGEGIYADPREPQNFEFTERYKELTGSQTVYIQTEDEWETVLAKGLPSKQLILMRPEEQEDAITRIRTELAKDEYLVNGKAATIIRGNLGWFLEVLHPDVCKGNGLKQMCRHLKIPVSECVAFGDGDNDLEFIQYAGKGIVMKNGRACVKKVADEVIDFTNNEDGVIKTLQTMEKNGELVFTKSA